MVSFGIAMAIIIIGLGIFCMVVERKPLEEKGEFWKVHLYSGGKEVINYTTVGRIRNHSNNSTISFIDVLSGKEIVVSGTFMAEEF
jgi:hypothetical protein